MSDERRIGSDIVAVILLTFIVFLVASLATYDPADPVINSSRLLNSIYQPDVLDLSSKRGNPELVWHAGSVDGGHADSCSGNRVVLSRSGADCAWKCSCFGTVVFALRGSKPVGWMISLVGLSAVGYLLLPDWIAGPVIGSGGYLGALSGGLAETERRDGWQRGNCDWPDVDRVNDVDRVPGSACWSSHVCACCCGCSVRCCRSEFCMA